MPSSQRLFAFQTIQERPATVPRPSAPLQELWAQDLFDLAKLKADQAMKKWATSLGSLYYAKVFYPLTNSTAEKIGLKSSGIGRSPNL